MDITIDRYRLQNYCYIKEYNNNKVTEVNKATITFIKKKVKQNMF